MEIDLDRLHAQTTVTDQYCALVIAREIRALYAGFDNRQTRPRRIRERRFFVYLARHGKLGRTLKTPSRLLMTH